MNWSRLQSSYLTKDVATREFNDKHVAQSAFDQDDCITIFTKSVFVFANMNPYMQTKAAEADF